MARHTRLRQDDDGQALIGLLCGVLLTASVLGLVAIAVEWPAEVAAISTAIGLVGALLWKSKTYRRAVRRVIHELKKVYRTVTRDVRRERHVQVMEEHSNAWFGTFEKATPLQRQVWEAFHLVGGIDIARAAEHLHMDVNTVEAAWTQLSQAFFEEKERLELAASEEAVGEQ